MAEAKQLHFVMRQAEEQAARVRQDQALTPEMRASTRERLRQETEKAIQSVIGDQGWAQFNQRGCNWRLDRIYKRPAQPSTDAQHR